MFCSGKPSGHQRKRIGIDSPLYRWRMEPSCTLQSDSAYWSSYRYLLTPRSGLELNYQYAQEVQHFTNPTNNNLVHNRFQEISGAYVRSFTFRNFNPFLEAGIGGFIYSPIDDQKTTTQGLSRNTNVGLLYGGGIAYEISPSFDIRAEYRGLIYKTPTFGQTNFSTGRYYMVSDPVIGIAYHF